MIHELCQAFVGGTLSCHECKSWYLAANHHHLNSCFAGLTVGDFRKISLKFINIANVHSTVYGSAKEAQNTPKNIQNILIFTE